MPQKQPPANTIVCVFGGAAFARSAGFAAAVADTTARSPLVMSPRVNPRIMIPPSVPLSRSTFFFPLERIALGLRIFRTTRRRHLHRIAGRQYLDHFVGNVPGSHDPESDDQQQNDYCDQIVLVAANMSENDQ